MATVPNNQLAKANGTGQNHALSLVDERTRAQAQFLKMTLPYGQNLTDANAIALSAYCNQFGLNAQNGEAYFLVQVNAQTGARKELGLYPGIKAWRKKAKEQLQAVDKLANYKIDYERIDPGELGVVAAKRGDYAICIRARLTDDVSRAKYLAQYVELLKSGLKAPDIEDLIGKPPFWYGYGSVKVSELPYLKMEPLRVAEKRAEKDATSRRFDLPFADEALADDVDAGLVSEIEEPITRQAQPEQRKSPQQIISELYNEPAQEADYREESEPPEPESENTGDAPATLFDTGPADPYADLRAKAETDPKTAARMLAVRIGWKPAEVEALSKENQGDWAKTFAGLLRNAPPA